MPILSKNPQKPPKHPLGPKHVPGPILDISYFSGISSGNFFFVVEKGKNIFFARTSLRKNSYPFLLLFDGFFCFIFYLSPLSLMGEGGADV